MNGAFLNRTDAGRLLAPLLREFAHCKDVIVLALPRGGVLVGVEIARQLHVPIDVLVVRKLGVPGQEELAMGAIASHGVEFRDAELIAALHIPTADVDAVVAREREELQRRERVYRGTKREPSLYRKTVILVDDGIATGATMRVAVRVVKSQRPRAIVIATPVASAEATECLRQEVTSVVVLHTTPHLFAIGHYYRDFTQVTDLDVQTALSRLPQASTRLPQDEMG